MNLSSETGIFFKKIRFTKVTVMDPAVGQSSGAVGTSGGGMKTRSVARGVRPRLGFAERRSPSEPTFSENIDILPTSKSLKAPVHPKKRVLTEKLDFNPTIQAKNSPLDVCDYTKPRPQQQSEVITITEVVESVSSPGLNVECGDSGGPSTSKRPASSGAYRTTKIRRQQNPSPKDIMDPLLDKTMCTVVNYGSEEDESDDECDELAFVSRKARIHFGADIRECVSPSHRPSLRGEVFSQTNVGPTVSFTHPYDAFTTIWDYEIVQLIVTEINNFAQQIAATMLENNMIHPSSRINRWHDTTVNEIYTYLALVLSMGMVFKSRIEDYWSSTKDIFVTPGFSTHMSYGRFSLISKCLNFKDNRDCDVESFTRPEKGILKIKPIIDHLNHKFSNLYNLSQNLCLIKNHSMWKTGLDKNQLIMNTSATVNITTYEVCESETGYLWRFHLDACQDTETVHEGPLSETIPALALKLLDGLEHKGHTISMNRFFNSPALARDLKIPGFDCVGTLRTNRQCVSTELANSCMGGVDRRDRILSMYPIERMRTRVWYEKMFRRLLNVSVLNAHILYNDQMGHYEFRRTLISSLLETHCVPTAPTNEITTTSEHHFPAQYNIITPGKSDRLKRKCAVCSKRTSTYCKTCNVAMCVFTCFGPYHNKNENLPPTF